MYPLTEKTQRHLFTTLLQSNKYLKVYLIQTLLTHAFIYNKYFNVIYLYKYILYKLSNTLISNLVLSTKYFSLKLAINSNVKDVTSIPKTFTPPKTIYYYTVKKISSFFHKTKTNKILYLYVHFLMSYYHTHTNLTKLASSGVFLIKNFNLLTFINLFYFKIRNY
jgi:hypothetical protein